MASLKTIHQRKETLKTILTLVAAALGVIQTSARAAEEPAWSIEAKMISADSCSVGCPCILGEPPTHGQCQYVALWQVDKGQYGDVKLDGVKFAFAGEFCSAGSYAKSVGRLILAKAFEKSITASLS